MKRWFDWEHIASHNSRSRGGRRPLHGVARRKRWFADLRGAFEQLEDRRLLAVDPSANGAATQTALVQSEYGQLPLSFEANQGQTDSRVDYLARGAGYTMFLTGSGAVIDLRQAAPSPARGSDPTAPSQPNAVSGTVIDMQFVGANPSAIVKGVDKQQTVSNYLVGNDPSQWHAGIANYGQVEYQNLYSGIDAVFHGNQGQLEYDFNVAPGADPHQIQLQIAGASGLSLDSSGNLLIHTAGGDLVEKAPNIYQEIGGQRVAVSGHFTLEGGDRVGFAIGSYDASLPLVIDPTLSYSTYLGGSGGSADGDAIAVDSSGNAYVAGNTTSTSFPTTPGAYQTTYGGSGDAFVTKFSADGKSLVYSTYLGGSSLDLSIGIAVDSSGNAYIVGATFSTNFPTTAGAFQTAFGGGASDAFVTKLSASGGSLVYSTYLGGSSFENGRAVAINGAGNAYVTGETTSSDFPTTAGAYQTMIGGNSDAYVTEFNAAGSGLVYSTYLGGADDEFGSGIAIDAAGNAYVAGGTFSTNFPTTSGAYRTSFVGTGPDAFVTKLNASGSALVYSTYVGTVDATTVPIAIDGSGNAYLTGSTSATDFPTTPGAFQTTYGGGGDDAFVTKLNAAGSGLVYSTYLGGSGVDEGAGIAVNDAGDAFVIGSTSSTNFPTTPDAIQTTYGGSSDVFLTKLNALGSNLLSSTYIGGSDPDLGRGVALDGPGNAYATGLTGSTNFPVTSGAYQTTLAGTQDAFVAKFQFLFAPPTTPVDSDPAPNTVLEGAAVGTYVGLTASSTDPEGGSIAYSLTSDCSGGGFQIDPATGRVTVADGGKISYLATPSRSYQVTVQATSTGGLTSSQTFTIAVTTETTQNQRFIAELYLDLLNRPVDPGALAYWVGRLSAGQTRSQVAFDIEQSLEYRQHVVVGLYSRYLHRAADPGGLSFFTQLLGQGFTVEQVSAMLAGSTEYFVLQGGTNDGFLNALYQDALGRPIDPGGLAWWNAQLAAGLSRTQVADLILASDEYRQDLVQTVFQQLLCRAPTPGGLTYWVSVLEAGATDQQLNAAIAGSEEYYARTA